MTLAKNFPLAIMEIPARFEAFVNNLVNRSIKETESPTDPSKKDVFVIRCWNAIRTLADSKLLVENKEYLAKYDIMLAPVYRFLATPDSICFDDDILDILISISKANNDIPPNLAGVIQYFPEILTKYKGQISQLLVTYNAYFKSYKQIFDNKKILDMTIDIGIRATTEPNETMIDMHKAEGILLFHLMIAAIPEKLSEENWMTIFNHTTSLCQLEACDLFFSSRVLGVFLIGFIYSPLVTFNYCMQNNCLDMVIEWIYSNMKQFKTTYDRKILIMGFINLWKLQFENETLNDFILKVFEHIIYMMIIQEFDEQKKFFKTNISNDSEMRDRELCASIKQNIFGEEGEGHSHFEPEEEDEDEIFHSMMSNSDPVAHTIKLLDIQINHEDEYLIFAGIFNAFKETHYQRLQFFCTSIGELAQQGLKMVIQSKRVKGSNNNSVPRKIIKVKKINRKMNLG